MKDLTIIILTYNSSHIIEKSLQNLDFSAYDVVLVDNASSDDTVTIAKEKFPLLKKIIELPRNIGYGRGNNVALKQVDTDFALILNPDSIIEKKEIETVLLEMKKDQKVALATPIMLKEFPFNQKEFEKRIENIGADFNSEKKRYFAKEGDNFLSNFLSGAALFMNVAAMRKIGFFDEKIFLYYEDDELSWRVLQNGYKNLLVTKAIFFHPKGVSSSIETRKIIFTKSWHEGWSKLYWKEIRDDIKLSKFYIFNLVINFLARSLVEVSIFNRKKIIKRFGIFCGSVAFLLGFAAFDENDKPRTTQVINLWKREF